MQNAASERKSLMKSDASAGILLSRQLRDVVLNGGGHRDVLHLLGSFVNANL